MRQTSSEKTFNEDRKISAFVDSNRKLSWNLFFIIVFGNEKSLPREMFSMKFQIPSKSRKIPYHLMKERLNPTERIFSFFIIIFEILKH